MILALIIDALLIWWYLHDRAEDEKAEVAANKVRRKQYYRLLYGPPYEAPLDIAKIPF